MYIFLVWLAPLFFRRRWDFGFFLFLTLYGKEPRISWQSLRPNAKMSSRPQAVLKSLRLFRALRDRFSAQNLAFVEFNNCIFSHDYRWPSPRNFVVDAAESEPPNRSYLQTLQTCLFDPEFFTMRPGFFHNATSSTYRSVELCLLSLCFRSVYGVLRSLFVFAEFFYLAPCSSMHLPSYRESKPRRDCSLWCLPCIVPYAVIIFEVVLCAVGPLVSKYLSLNTISPTSCLFWLEFTVSEEKPCASGTQGCSLLPSLKFIPFVLQSVILDATVWQSTTVESLNPTT